MCAESRCFIMIARKCKNAPLIHQVVSWFDSPGFHGRSLTHEWWRGFEIYLSSPSLSTRRWGTAMERGQDLVTPTYALSLWLCVRSGRILDPRDATMSHCPNRQHSQDQVWRCLFHSYNFLWISIQPCCSYFCSVLLFKISLNGPTATFKLGQGTSEPPPSLLGIDCPVVWCIIKPQLAKWHAHFALKGSCSRLWFTPLRKWIPRN